jgi:hypothetical protein
MAYAVDTLATTLPSSLDDVIDHTEFCNPIEDCADYIDEVEYLIRRCKDLEIEELDFRT